MRFSIASVFFIISGFIFLVCWGVSSLLMTTVSDAMSPFAQNLDSSAEVMSWINILPTVFGFLCALFFIIGIILIFVLDALADEPELYWRGGPPQ